MKKVFDVKNMGVNPFTATLKIPVRKLKGKETLLTEFTEGISLPIGTLQQTVLLEDIKYSKLYHSAWMRDLITDLSPIALKVFMYVAYSLNTNEDYYTYNKSFMVKKLNLKNQKELIDVTNNELIRYGLLGLSLVPDTFWINPNYMYCGNRVKMYPKNVVIR
jgi:hypothetical protein